MPYFDQIYYPFADETGPKTIPEAMKESMWHAVGCPPGPWVDAAQLREGAKRLRQGTDKAIVGGFGGNLLETGQFLYRNDNFYMLLAAEPERAHKFLDDLAEIHLKNLEQYLGAVGDYIGIVKFGDDLGMQSGPQISPKMYREFFPPRHKLMWARAKELANVKVMLHCCGVVRELFPDLIDAGLDAINVAAPNPRGGERVPVSPKDWIGTLILSFDVKRSPSTPPAAPRAGAIRR